MLNGVNFRFDELEYRLLLYTDDLILIDCVVAVIEFVGMHQPLFFIQAD